MPGFKPRRGSHVGWNHAVWGAERGNLLPHGLGSRKARCSSHEQLSVSSLEECRRGIQGRKEVKGLLLVGQEKVPCGFALRTGDPSNTADSAGNHGRPAS